MGPDTSGIRTLLDRIGPGRRRAVEEHKRRGEHIAAMIRERFGIRSVWQWRVKHVRWALEVGLRDLAPATRYRYFLTARYVAAALGRWADWEPHLHGPWTDPRGDGSRRGPGGRPPRLPKRLCDGDRAGRS